MCKSCWKFICVGCYNKVKSELLKFEQFSIILSNIEITYPMLIDKDNVPKVQSN